MKLIFAGTPDFAAQHLNILIDAGHELLAVYTQPDRPGGRGKKPQASPVKKLALKHDIPVEQPLNFRSDEALQALAAYQAELMVVVAYGIILPQTVLDTPKLGCINVHASILPRWRGAAPIQRAIEAGDDESGVTIMQMDAGLDTGDMLQITRLTLDADETAASLHDRLAEIGGPALLSTIEQLEQGSAIPQKQDDQQACYAHKISKQEARIDWTLPADIVDRKIRAFTPFPGAYTELAGQRIKLHRARPQLKAHNAKPGTVLSVDAEGIDIACGEQSYLHIETLQWPGSRAMAVADLLNGHPDRIRAGDQLD